MKEEVNFFNFKFGSTPKKVFRPKIYLKILFFMWRRMYICWMRTILCLQQDTLQGPTLSMISNFHLKSAAVVIGFGLAVDSSPKCWQPTIHCKTVQAILSAVNCSAVKCNCSEVK